MTEEILAQEPGADPARLERLARELSQPELSRVAALETFARLMGVEAAGEGAAPAGAREIQPGLWVRGTPADFVGAAAAVLRLALDRIDAVEEARASWGRCATVAFDGLALVRDGKIEDANPALCGLLGRSRDELVGRSLESIVVARRRDQVRGGLAAGRLVARRMEVLAASGAVLPVALRISPCTQRGRAAWLVAIQDRRDAEEAQRRARETRVHAAAERVRHAHFLSSLGHELRTPLDGILGMLDLLLQGRLAPDQRQRGRVVRDSAAHLASVLDDLVDLASAREQGLELHAAPTVLRRVLDGALGSVRGTAARAGIELRLDLAPGLASAWTLDGRRVRQLLVNLLGHAVRHTSTGVVRLSVSQGPRGLRLEVSRSAAALSRAERDLVAQGTRWGGSGASIGLAICHELVELMRGQVTALAGPRGGVGLRVELPVEPLAQRLPRGCRVALVGSSSAGLAAALTARGATVIVVAAAGDELRAWAPDLVHWVTGRPVPGPWIATSPRAWPGQPGLRVVPKQVTAEELLMVALPPELESAPVSVSDARTLSVLVVEDNVISQQVVGEMLRKAGHAVEVVANGKLGVEAALQRRPDLILMDVQMPVMDGLQAASALRAAQCSAPIVALTAHATPEDRLACEQAGMDGYLAKPVRVAQLNTVLSGLGAQLPQLGGG
jgi:PAS domain S-box-containing protein